MAGKPSLEEHINLPYIQAMKKLFVLTLFFLSTTLLAQNIPSIEQVEAKLEEFKKKDDLRAYTLELARQRDSLIILIKSENYLLQDTISRLKSALNSLKINYERSEYALHQIRAQTVTLKGEVDSLKNENSELTNIINDIAVKLEQCQYNVNSPTITSENDNSGHDCCKTCYTGKACGDTCIARGKTCRVGPGCACNGY